MIKSYLDLARRALKDSDTSTLSLPHYDINDINDKSTPTPSLPHYDINDINDKSTPTPSLRHYDEIRHYDINKTMEEREEAPRAVPGAAPPLEAVVRFDVPGAGDVWLVPDADAAERLGIPAGQWLTPADLALLEGLGPAERVEVLVWMREAGGRLVAAPAPARRFGSGERGWQRWRLANIYQQIREYRRTSGKT